MGLIVPPISDHAPVTFSLSVNVKSDTSSNLSDLLPRPDKVVWDKSLADRFTILLQAPACKEIIADVVSKGVGHTQLEIDTTATLFSEILKGTAEQAGM